MASRQATGEAGEQGASVHDQPGRGLHGFAYRVLLTGWTFVLAPAAGLVIAWLTVSYQSFKVARAKPAGALRYE